MSSKRRKPQWWQLYVGLPILTGLFVPETRLQLTGTEHILAQLAILGLIYGFVHWWLQANRAALIDVEQEEGEWQVRVYEIGPHQLRSADERRQLERRGFELATHEIKGVLDTAAEMDDVEQEASFLPRAEAFRSHETVDAEDTRN